MQRVPRVDILVVDPGSTSTKLGWFEGGEARARRTLSHPLALTSRPIAAQRAARAEAVQAFIDESGVASFDAVIALGGLLGPVEGGVYAVDEAMCEVLLAERFGSHASALGALLAADLARATGGRALVMDPISTDELAPVARVSGVPGVERWGRSHALSLKAVARRASSALDLALQRTRLVALHLGGGVSVAAVRGGRIVDVNDAMLGMGPFSPTRAGALPIRGVLDLAFAAGAERAALERRLVKESGLMGYLGTADLAEVEARVEAGDELARQVYEALEYQIVKEAGAMAAVFGFDVHGVVLTGGMAQSEQLTRNLTAKLGRLGPVFCYPGELEIEALAQGALRVLRGEEAVREYRAEG